MMMKIGMEVDQSYTVFNYGPPIPQKYLNLQDRTIMARPGMKQSPKYFLPGHSKEKVWKDPPPNALIMDNLESSLDTTVDKPHKNTSVASVERLIKPRA